MAQPDQARNSSQAGKDAPVRRSDDSSPVGIYCGGGALPFTVAEAVRRQGRKPVLFPIKHFADPARVAAYEHYWVPLGKFGLLRRLARQAGCRDIVFIGALVRPRVSQIRLDWETIKLLPRIAAGFRGGDDGLLTTIGGIFEDHGFHLVGPHELAPEILVPRGVLGGIAPRDSDRTDIARGLAVLDATGAFDIGQGAVVADNRVLAIEAAEGTDEMLRHVAELRERGRIRSPAGTGVLIKAPKHNQDRRFDLPSIGPQTVEGVMRAGLAGIAVVAGGSVIADPQRLTALADRGGVFVVGVAEDGTFD